MKTLLKNRELSAFIAILALFAVLVGLNPAYFSLQTLGMIFASSQILILLALGAALVILMFPSALPSGCLPLPWGWP